MVELDGHKDSFANPPRGCERERGLLIHGLKLLQPVVAEKACAWRCVVFGSGDYPNMGTGHGFIAKKISAGFQIEGSKSFGNRRFCKRGGAVLQD
jgi:hypothetical protein